MKKKILSFVGLAAFAGLMAFNVNMGLNSNAEIDVMLANMEVIAQTELPDTNIDCTQSNCRGGRCHQSTYNSSCPCEANGMPGWTCNNWSGI